MTSGQDCVQWDLFLGPLAANGNGDSFNSSGKYAVILLNHCLDNLLSQMTMETFLGSTKFKHFRQLWNNGLVRISVDGGTNILNDIQKLVDIDERLNDPTYITGDFDSIRDDVMEHFRRIDKVKILNTPDQDHTDFSKSLSVLKKHISSHSDLMIDSIFVFYSNFGRIDQYLSILSTVHQFSDDGTMPPIILVDVIDSITFVLNKGFHRVPRFIGSKWCSLIPLKGPVTLSTTGLRWNIDGGRLEFGKFISSSNEFDPKFDHVTIEVIDEQILFSGHYLF